jgi:hypothetical protein
MKWNGKDPSDNTYHTRTNTGTHTSADIDGRTIRQFQNAIRRRPPQWQTSTEDHLDDRDRTETASPRRHPDHL